MTMSRHAKEDRLDRLVYIATTIGFGNVIFEKHCGDKRECITDTGVLLVKAANEELLITAYILAIDKATAVYASIMGEGKRLPQSLYNTIKKNTVHLKKQDCTKF
jgi:hypothetical protein